MPKPELNLRPKSSFPLKANPEIIKQTLSLDVDAGDRTVLLTHTPGIE